MSVFVSHDGGDSNGYRAEVAVSTGRGVVESIDESKDKSAKVIFKVSWLKYPVGGWVGKDEPLYHAAVAAKESGEEVNFRVEYQRRKSVDRTIPIEELRATTESSKDNVIAKLASINDVVGSEALTHPSEDDVPGAPKAAGPSAGTSAPAGQPSAPAANKDDLLGKVKALNTNRNLPQGVIDALIAQAVIAGATPDEIIVVTNLVEETPTNTPRGFATEAPSFKEYNNDGRVNLGNFKVAAGVGVANFLARKIQDAGFNVSEKPETLSFFTKLVLNIADTIQTGPAGYGAGFTVDRTAGSHTRIRSCIYDVIDSGHTLPITTDGGIAEKDVTKAWMVGVGVAARERFALGASAVYSTDNIPTLLASLDAAEEDQSQAEQTTEQEDQSEESTTPDEPTSAPQSAPQQPETVLDLPDTPTPPPFPSKQESATPSEPKKMVHAAGLSNKLQEIADAGELLTYPVTLLPSGTLNASNKATEETINSFKEFITEEVGLTTSEEQSRVSALLAATFGPAYNKITNLTDESAGEFLDLYVSAGKENFVAVLDALK